MKIIKKNWYYLVESSTGGFYTVNLDRMTCECPDFRFRKNICKHLAAVKDLVHVDALDDFEKAVNHVADGISKDEFTEKFSHGLLLELIERKILKEIDGKIKKAQ